MPCAARARTAAAVSSLMTPLRACDPPLATVPAQCRLSFTATGTPCRGPIEMPAANSRSAASAWAIARSAVTWL
ncbi:Uncharacterised protein [Achromobacter xylosoxidans]|nr:Uncharacterised protein [Achromobacter xylosoxidans]